MAVENETAESATAEETQAEETTERAASEETEKTEQSRQPGRAEQRIKRLVSERDEARKEAERFKREAETKSATRARENEQVGDDDGMAQARRLIETTVRELLDREQVPLGKLKQALTTTEDHSKEVGRQKWERWCAKHRLDSENEDLQDFALGATARGLELDDVVDRAIKAFGTVKRTASVEQDGVTPSLVRSDLKIWDKKAASDAASKGITGAHIDVEDIVARIQKDRAKG